MNRKALAGVWWVPLLLAAAPVFKLVPGHRDLLDFFAPMRHFTATALASGTMPWLNLANGCGEAWFANPETAVLYPPAWLHLVLPPAWALSVEVAVHLAWLSLGAGLLARSLGAESLGRLVVEAAAWSIGPVVFTVGVLNNLETLAWVPWMLLAARGEGPRAVGLVALTTALAWLGGEPQIWAMAVALMVLTGRRRAVAAAGAVVGVTAVAVQLVPFVFWVLEGDRGLQAADWVLRGAVAPRDWLGVLVPGRAVDAGRMVYAESLFLGAPLLVCGLFGAFRYRWLLAAVACLGVLATLPEVGGGSLVLAVTGGLVRYPSRFAVIALTMLLPLMGSGAGDWLAGRWRPWAAAVAGSTLLLCAATQRPSAWLVAGIPAALMLAGSVRVAWRDLRAVALAAGVVATAAASWPLLGLQPTGRLEDRRTVWPEAANGERVWTPSPAAGDTRWMARGLEPRRLWPVGYLNLVGGLTLVRTDAPVAHAALMDHLRIADEGPYRRWWLDVLAARWVILPESAGVPPGMDPVRIRGGMRLFRNPRAVAVVSVAAATPQVGRLPGAGAEAGELGLAGNRCRASLELDERSWLWVSLAPLRGWSWSLDGVEVALERGPGMLQFLEVGPGRHELVGRYRPPGLPAAGAVSGCGLLLVLLLLASRRGRPAPTPARLE